MAAPGQVSRGDQHDQLRSPREKGGHCAALTLRGADATGRPVCEGRALRAQGIRVSQSRAEATAAFIQRRVG
ncbi:hypothetical protein BMI87_07545 [Thioclava sp. F28-4]|nr:hypothetical protein BMI87_07545 [Thioclava sp. F28-4]